jgi:hypothetical protein
MLRGLPHLTKYAPEPVELRKMFPDPENEPDFYKISELFPLPGDRKDPREEARAALAARGIIISDMPQSTMTMPGGAYPGGMPNLLGGFGGGVPFNSSMPPAAMGPMTSQFFAPQYNMLPVNGQYMSALDQTQLNASLQAQAQLNVYRNQPSSGNPSEETRGTG